MIQIDVHWPIYHWHHFASAWMAADGDVGCPELHSGITVDGSLRRAPLTPGPPTNFQVVARMLSWAVVRGIDRRQAVIPSRRQANL